MIRVAKGGTYVTVEGALAAKLERKILAALGPMGEQLQADADAVVAEAREQWPVGDRGGRTHSRDQFTTTLELDPAMNKVAVRIRNRAKYVQYIRSNKEGRTRGATRRRSPFEAHVVEPTHQRRQKQISELSRLVVKSLNKQLKG